MPYVRPGAASTGNTALPANLQLKKREQENEDNTPKNYTGAVGKSGSILTKGLLPKTAKTTRLGERSVAFNPKIAMDTFTPLSPENSDTSDDEPLDTPDGLDSFELSQKEIDADKTDSAASGSQEKTRAIETALALLDASQSEAIANRPGLSAHRQKQLAQKAKAETVQAEKAE